MTTIYRCNTCKFPFTTKASRTKHYNTVDCERDKYIDMEPKVLKCDHCDKTSFRRDNINDHMKICGKNPSVVAKKNLTVNGNGNVTEYNNINNITNHNAPVINNFIVVNPTSIYPYHICFDLMTFDLGHIYDMLQSDNMFLKYFELMHCNLRKPNCLNIRYINDQHLRVFTDNGWVTKNAIKVMQTVLKNECIIFKKYALLEQKYLPHVYMTNIEEALRSVCYSEKQTESDKEHKYIRDTRNNVYKSMINAVKLMANLPFNDYELQGGEKAVGPTNLILEKWILRN